MSKNNNDSIKRTGELLLSGWKMLSKSCPICNTALLSKGENLRCPTCDCAVVTEASQAAMQSVTSSSQKASAGAVEHKFEIEDDYYQYAASGHVQHESLEEQKKEYDAKNKARNNEVSDKLGAKMLAGWSMLSTICPQEGCRGTPLMRLGSGPMLCVACDSEYKCSALGDLVPVKSASTTASPQPSKASPAVATSKAIASPAPVIPQSAAEDPSFFLDMNNAPILDLSKFSRSVDDASNKISRKLMQGWAMLDKCCNSAECKGEVPLMRDLSGQECCVQCGFPNAPSSASATTTKSNTHIPASVQPRSSEDSDSDGSDSDTSYGRARASVAQKPAQKSHQQAAVPRKRVEVDPESLSDDDSVADRLMFESYQQRWDGVDAKRAPAASAAAAAAVSAAPLPVPVSCAAVSGGARSKANARAIESQQRVASVDSSSSSVAVPLQILHQKLHEAAEQLSGCSNLDTSMKLADLIAKLGTAIHSLQSL